MVLKPSRIKQSGLGAVSGLNDMDLGCRKAFHCPPSKSAYLSQVAESERVFSGVQESRMLNPQTVDSPRTLACTNTEASTCSAKHRKLHSGDVEKAAAPNGKQIAPSCPTKSAQLDISYTAAEVLQKWHPGHPVHNTCEVRKCWV